MVIIMKQLMSSDDGDSKVEDPLFRQVPDCMHTFHLPQPAEYGGGDPRGGGDCRQCSTVEPGWVYGWSVGGTYTKIGCTKGAFDNEAIACTNRIKQQLMSENDFNQVVYQCAYLDPTFRYERYLFNRPNDTKNLTVCNAAEVLLQDYNYCMGVWAGREGIGKPPISKEGKSEWFNVQLGVVRAQMGNFLNASYVPP